MGLGRIGGQMQIGEQDLTGAQHRPFGGLRFFDLDDHVAGFEHLGGGADDLRPGGDVIGIRKARAGACIGFDRNLMPMRHGLARGIGGDADAVFLRLDFLGASDVHGALLLGLGSVSVVGHAIAWGFVLVSAVFFEETCVN